MLSMKIFLVDPNHIYTIETRIEQSTEIANWCGRIAYHDLEYGVPRRRKRKKKLSDTDEASCINKNT